MEQQFFPSSVNYRFYLRDIHKKKPVGLFLKIRFEGITTQIRCHGIKVYKEQWCQSKQRAYISPILSPLDNYNNAIVNKTIEEYVRKIEDYMENSWISQKKYVSFHCGIKQRLMEKKKSYKDKEIFDIYAWMKRSIINDVKISQNTSSNYMRSLTLFQEFVKWRVEQGFEPITSFSQIDSALMDEFSDYICYEAKTPTGDEYAVVTVNSKLKQFMSVFHNYAHKSKTITKEVAQLVGYEEIPNKGNSRHIALRDDEIYKLWHYKCKSAKDEEIRDMFLILCTCGLRIGDLGKLSKGYEMVGDVDKISFVQNKTQETVDVPFVFKLTKEIFAKYDNTLPKVNVKQINENIGRIAAEAKVGTDENVIVTRHYAGESKVRQETKKRCNCIKSHTGRRTLCTLLAHRGWTFERIKQYSGHAKASTIEKNYCKMDDMSQLLFAKLCGSNPEMVLEYMDSFKLISTNPTQMQPQQAPPKQSCQPPLPISNPITDGNLFVNSVDEAKRVLNYLGADVDDYIEENDINQLIRMICHYEGRIVGGYAKKHNIEKIKEIFNEYADPKLRKEHLHTYAEYINAERSVSSSMDKRRDLVIEVCKRMSDEG